MRPWSTSKWLYPAVLLVPGMLSCSSTPNDFEPSRDPKSPLAGLEFDGSPSAIDRALDAALAAFKAQHFIEVKAITDDLMIEAPHHPRADVVLFLGAESRIELDELDAAAQMYQRLASTYPWSRTATIVPQRLFDIGSSSLEHAPVTWLDALQSDDRHAIEALSRVATDYPNSAVADDAWMRLAAAHLADSRPDLAARAYVRLIESHPDSELIEDATFQLIDALAQKSRGAGYDSEPMLAARDAAVAYLKRFGIAAKHSLTAARAIQEFTEKLVANENRIADFYAQRGNARGEELHRNNAKRLEGEATVGANSSDLLKARTGRSRFAELESSRGGFLVGWPGARTDIDRR